MDARSKRKISILLSETNSTIASGNLLILPVGEYSIDINITTINGDNAIIIGIYQKGKMNTIEGHLGTKIYKTNIDVMNDWSITNSSIKSTIITPTSIDIS